MDNKTNFNFNPIYVYLGIASIEEIVFRYLPYMVINTFFILDNTLHSLDEWGYILLTSIIYSLSHKIMFSWKMVGITFILGLLFSGIWILLGYYSLIITILIHYIFILLNIYKFKIN